MPNPLVAPAVVGAAGNVVSGLVGAISSSANRQYNYQKRLMNIQNQYNVQNATTAYNRSRQLTQDSSMLEKLGKQQAGINTAFTQNGNVANAASAPQADGVSVPTPPDVSASTNALSSGINNAVQNLIGVATAKANIRKLTSEAEGNEIDNITRQFLNMKKAGLMTSETRKNFEDAANRAIENKFAESRYSAEADSANSKAIIDQADSGVRAAMNKADYDLKVQELFNKVQTGVLTQRQAMTELKKLSLMDSQINVNKSQAGLYASVKEGQDIENFVNDTTKGDKVATIQSGRIKAWYDAQPKNVQQLIMSSDAVRSAVHTLQTGRDLSWREYKALGAAMGYENAGKLVGSLIDALNIKAKGPAPKVSIVKHVSSKK